MLHLTLFRSLQFTILNKYSVLINLCNENQPAALFTLNLFRQSTSTCFGDLYCLSPGGIHCICTAIGTRYTFKLTGSWPGQDGTPS
jgi:hypothetical protein